MNEYVDEEWPHGLRCAACDRLFHDGMPVCERLDSVGQFADGEAVITVVIVCADCDLSGKELLT